MSLERSRGRAGGQGDARRVNERGQGTGSIDGLLESLTEGLRSVSLTSKPVRCDGPGSTSTSAKHEKENFLADNLVDKISSLNLKSGRLPAIKDTNAFERKILPVEETKTGVSAKRPVVAEKQDIEGLRLVHGQQVYSLPAAIVGALYPHQREGIHWLWGLHCKQMGGVLGDDMGLGKTMQVLQHGWC